MASVYILHAMVRLPALNLSPATLFSSSSRSPTARPSAPIAPRSVGREDHSSAYLTPENAPGLTSAGIAEPSSYVSVVPPELISYAAPGIVSRADNTAGNVDDWSTCVRVRGPAFGLDLRRATPPGGWPRDGGCECTNRAPRFGYAPSVMPHAFQISHSGSTLARSVLCFSMSGVALRSVAAVARRGARFAGNTPHIDSTFKGKSGTVDLGFTPCADWAHRIFPRPFPLSFSFDKVCALPPRFCLV